MTTTDERPGSPSDLSRRMDRLEAAHEGQARELASLAGSVAMLSKDLTHAEENNKYRFELLGNNVASLGTDLKAFMSRIEGMIDGTVQTTQSRQAAETLADYYRWRKEVDEDRERQAVLAGRLDLLGRLAVLLVGGNALALIAAIYAVVQTR